jgi:hypothetical protein
VRRRGVERVALRLCGLPGFAPGLIDEGRVEVDHDDAVVGGDGAQLLVGEVAREWVSARALECDAMMGARVVSRTWWKVLSATCETSTIMPRRFISRMTSRPKSVRPLWCVMEGSSRSPELSAHSLVLVQVRVM